MASQTKSLDMAITRVRHFARSYTGRLILGTLALHAVLFAILYSVVLHRTANEDRHRFVESAHGQAYVIALLLEETHQEPGAVAALADDLVRQGVVSYAEYVAASGEHIVSAYNPRNALFRADEVFGEHRDDTYYLTIVDPDADATLRVGFDETAVQEHVNDSYREGLGFGTAYILLTAAILAFIGRRLAESVRTLRDASRRIASGQIDERLTVGSGVGEIAELAQDLECMRQTLLARENELVHLATHDPLTGLPNRTLYQDRLSQVLAQAERSGHAVALLFVDLDRFKRINDTLGHPVGDELLRVASKRIKQCLREEDTLARIGGDEFTVILPRLPQASSAIVVAEHIIHALEPAFNVGGKELYMSCSIGIACYPLDGQEAGQLSRNADTAMYAAKNDGGMAYRFYSEQMNASAAHRLELETRLRHALERGELRVHYQPQVDAATNRIVGVEALVRWQHPELGLVPPADFIPLAEETGLIVPISEWVLRTACRQAKTWGDEGLEIAVGVNLSARHFADPSLYATLRGILQETGLPPHLLDLEMTESMVMQHGNDTIVILEQLKRLGVTLSLDDFGTGYSSLAYLRRFPIDTLKIDRAFIQDIDGETHDGTLAATIIAMAQNLHMKAVAEGVETDAQWEYVRAHGCATIQGYHFSRPLPPGALTRMLRENLKVAPAGEPRMATA